MYVIHLQYLYHLDKLAAYTYCNQYFRLPLFSLQIIWVLTGSLLAMAVIRLVNKDWDNIDAMIMLITSSIGVVVNIM